MKALGKIEQEGKKEEAITVEFADGILLHVPLQESTPIVPLYRIKEGETQTRQAWGQSMD